MHPAVKMSLAPCAPAFETKPAPRLPKILYIMGTGRSGTTILEILLASNPGMAGVGEVKHIFRDAYLRDLPCACGASGRSCELWSHVQRSTGWQLRDCAEIGAATERLESHGRFLLAWGRLIDKERLQRYRQANEQLFCAVAAAERAEIIVDSSKYAGRALLLHRAFPESVKVLCITREARGIIDAFQKKNDAEQRPKGPLAVAAYYFYVLFCMKMVKRRLGEQCFTIRFEDLNRDPISVLGEIEHWCAYSLATARAKLASKDLFQVGHIVTGNRIRKRRSVRFEPSAAKVSGKKLARAKVLAWLMERYRVLLGF